MSDSVRPQRQRPTRLLRPWDSPGKNTGVGCHCLLRVIPYLCTIRFVESLQELLCDWLLKQYSCLHFRIILDWDSPGGPVVQTLCVHCRGHGFPGRECKISRKLRSHMPCGVWLSLFLNKALLVPCLIHSLTFCQWLLWGSQGSGE